MTKAERSKAVATQLSHHLTYRLGVAFRVESKTIPCDGGPSVETVSVVADRVGTWPVVAVSIVDGAVSYQMPDAEIVKALGGQVAA